MYLYRILVFKCTAIALTIEFPFEIIFYFFLWIKVYLDIINFIFAPNYYPIIFYNKVSLVSISGTDDMYRAGGSDMLRGAVRVLVLRGRPRPEEGGARAGGARPAAARPRARRLQR